MHTPSYAGPRKEPVVAINSSSPLAGASAAAATTKSASGTEPKGKAPGYAPGSPVYPPERLPAPPRGSAPQNPAPGSQANLRPGGPAAAAGLAVATRAAATGAVDPRAPVAPGSLTAQAGTPGTAPANTSQQTSPALASRGRPRQVTPAKAVSEAAVAALALAPITGIAAAESAPPAGSADNTAALAADPIRGAPAPAQLATDLQASLSPLSSPRTPAPAAPQSGEEDAGPNFEGPIATGLSASTTAAPPPPTKLTPSTSLATDPGPQSRSDDGSVTTGAAPDPGMLSVGFGTDRVAAESTVAAPLTVQTPVGTSGWTEEVGTHVIFMAHQGISGASLRLQPEHLGPLEVKISLHDSTASVWFGANESETRTALQAALPQLKEMFAAQGMTLTDAGVSREPPRDARSTSAANRPRRWCPRLQSPRPQPPWQACAVG